MTDKTGFHRNPLQFIFNMQNTTEEDQAKFWTQLQLQCGVSRRHVVVPDPAENVIVVPNPLFVAQNVRTILRRTRRWWRASDIERRLRLLHMITLLSSRWRNSGAPVLDMKEDVLRAIARFRLRGNRSRVGYCNQPHRIAAGIATFLAVAASATDDRLWDSLRTLVTQSGCLEGLLSVATQKLLT
jgi:hypothetical protein